MKILAVDDDQSVRELLDLVLNVHGHTTTIEKNGKEAITAFTSEPFDLVLTDINMPDLDGNELVRFIKASSRRTPVVALTGETETASELFDRVIGKPVYTKDLISTIDELLPDQHTSTQLN